MLIFRTYVLEKFLIKTRISFFRFLNMEESVFMKGRVAVSIQNRPLVQHCQIDISCSMDTWQKGGKENQSAFKLEFLAKFPKNLKIDVSQLLKRFPKFFLEHFKIHTALVKLVGKHVTTILINKLSHDVVFLQLDIYPLNSLFSFDIWRTERFERSDFFFSTVPN